MQSGQTPKISDIDSDTQHTIPPRDEFQQFKIHQKHIKNKLSQINQPVSIMDIVVLQEETTIFSDNNNGEFNYTSCYKKKLNHLTRMQNTIELLAVIAEKIHLKENFTSDGKIKSDKINDITRLVLHEFALYTENNPLTRIEFQELIIFLQKISHQMPENLHLVFSSIAVIDKYSQKEYTNNVIYVACGQNEQIHVITKIATAFNDPKYTNFNNFSLQVEDGKTELPEIAGDWLGLSPNSPIIKNFNGVIKCKTAGNAEFYTVLEICLDHLEGDGRLAYEKTIENIKKNNDDNELIPNQISQLVISNSIKIVSRNFLVTNVVQVDPNRSYSQNIYPVQFTFDNTYHKKLGFNIFKEYPHINIMQFNTSTLAITNPPFGPDLTIQIFPKQPLNQPNKAYVRQIANRNEVVINKFKPVTMDNLFSKPSSLINAENLQIIKKITNDLAATEARLQTFKNNIMKTCAINNRLFKSNNPIEKQSELIKKYKDELHKLSDEEFESNVHDVLIKLQLESSKYNYANEINTTVKNLLKYLAEEFPSQLKSFK